MAAADSLDHWRELLLERLDDARAGIERMTRRLDAAHRRAGDGAVDWKHAEEQARNETRGAQRSLATVLARTKRLRALLSPPFPEPCQAAIALAESLRVDETHEHESPVILRDRL